MGLGREACLNKRLDDMGLHNNISSKENIVIVISMGNTSSNAELFIELPDKG